jgi:ubiquinone/menaquinone biosynthesis C-methylase UbiE
MQREFKPGVIDLTRQVIGITQRLLIDAPIRPGMRVLDLGCGRGDVSLLVAELVGSQGCVVGVDRDRDALKLARQRAEDAGRSTIEFIQGDLETFDPGAQLFDAATTRRTLVYLRDPAAVLRRVSTMLKPGAIVAIQEHDGSQVPLGSDQVELQRRVLDWIWRTLAHEGANIGIGFALPSIIAAARLELLSIRVESIAQTPTAHYPVTGLAPILIPRMEAAGVATAAEIDADTLDDRLISERQTTGATVITDLIFCAIARRPA